MAPREASAATRRRILDVALDLFVEQGYDRTSLREIAERLGFSKAALYYHYKAKDDILQALADALLEDLRNLVERVEQEPAGPGRARRALTELVDLMLRQRRTAQLVLSQAPAVQRLKESRDEHFQARIMGLVVSPDAPLTARLRASAALAVAQSALWHLQERDVETVRATILALAEGCLAPDAAAVPGGAGAVPEVADADTADAEVAEVAAPPPSAERAGQA
jgi:AcrR family transcriptional regulator